MLRYWLNVTADHLFWTRLMVSSSVEGPSIKRLELAFALLFSEVTTGTKKVLN